MNEQQQRLRELVAQLEASRVTRVQLLQELKVNTRMGDYRNKLRRHQSGRGSR